MLTTLRPTAVLLAFFGGYLIPVALLFAAGAMAIPDGNSFSSPLLSVLIVSSYIVLPLLAGFLAGVLAHRAPFLHAIAASLLGSAMYALMHESITATECIWWMAVNAAGAISGAWLSTRMLKGRNPGEH